jgi:hypothetical protein
MKKTPDGKVHDCATHVEHTELGKGVTISEQHAEPDESGNIEWYAVQFDSGVYKVYTEDMDIIVSEAHHHGGKMKKEDTDNQIQELAGKAAQQAAVAISLIKAGKKDGKMPKPMKEDSEQVEEEEKKKVVSPFDYKNYTSQIPKKPGERAGFDSKKISTGTVYTRKPVKESTQITEAAGEDKAVSAIVAKHDSDSFHVKTVGHEHVYAGESGSPDAHVYHVHNTQTGKTHHIYMEHGGDAMSHREIKKQAGAHVSDAATKAIHKDPKKISTGTVYTRKPVKEAMSDQAKTTMKHIPNASPALKKAAKDIKPGVAGYRDRIDMLKAGGVKEEASKESKKDFQDRQQRLAAAGAETAKDPARLKRMSSIPGYSAAMDMAKKATTKEATDYTFAEYLDAARAQYVDEDAVLVANEAFKNKDITLFSDQSQSPEA